MIGSEITTPFSSDLLSTEEQLQSSFERTVQAHVAPLCARRDLTIIFKVTPMQKRAVKTRLAQWASERPCYLVRILPHTHMNLLRVILGLVPVHKRSLLFTDFSKSSVVTG